MDADFIALRASKIFFFVFHISKYLLYTAWGKESWFSSFTPFPLLDNKIHQN
ncbi:hypothetical protein ACEYW6_04375 [Nostoc sp. UIC 10607]|uniref:hypothetical protein n=1 Tax=Nostoc sp. UIC 10607 TaxID=3045935 RepID=UPI0039A0A69B